MGLLDNVGGFIKDAGHDIAHAAGNGYKAASDAWNTAVEDAKAAANVVGTVVRDADAKKEQIGAWIDSKEQQLEHKVDDGRAWLREHGGVAGKLASDQIGLVEGVGTSLYDAGKGIVKLADGVNSLTNPLEWAANPGANIARLKSGVQTVETLGKIANLAQPTSWLADPKGNAQLAGALWHSSSTSFHDDPAKFIGNAVGTVGTFFIPGGGEAAVAGDAGRAAAVLNDVGKVADVAKLADVADVAKVANTADAANGAGRLGGLAEDAGAAGRVAARGEDVAEEAAASHATAGANQFNRTPEEFDSLAADPAHGGKIDPKSIQERTVGLDLEKAGKVPGPIVRDPTGAAEFIDAAGTKWDVKGFNSNFPPRKGGFSLARDAEKVDKSLALDENVMLDTSKMKPADVAALKQEGLARGWGDRVRYWP